MEKNQDLGTCYICGKDFAVRGMTRHVKSCIKRIKGSEKCMLLHIKGGGPFFITLLAPLNGFTFAHLDAFIRGVWFECCGHLSRFDTGFDFWDDDGRSDEEFMKKSLKNIQNFGTLGYEYDFGSTSYAEIKFLDIVEINQKLKSFKVLAYNHIPVKKCESCEKNAKFMVEDYETGETVFACSEHGPKDDEDNEVYAFELINNPRVGFCGDTPDTDEEIKPYLWKN
jgi:hypothetical protein